MNVVIWLNAILLILCVLFCLRETIYLRFHGISERRKRQEVMRAFDLVSREGAGAELTPDHRAARAVIDLLVGMSLLDRQGDAVCSSEYPTPWNERGLAVLIAAKIRQSKGVEV